MDNGIFLSSHLLTIDRKFMSFVEFKRKSPAITKTNILMYEGVLKPSENTRGLKKLFQYIALNNIKQKPSFIFKMEINCSVRHSWVRDCSNFS